MSDHTAEAINECRENNSSRSICVAHYLLSSTSEVKHCTALRRERQ